MSNHNKDDVVFFFDDKKIAVFLGRIEELLPGTDSYKIRYEVPTMTEGGEPAGLTTLYVVKESNCLYTDPTEAWSTVIAKTEIRRSHAAKAHAQAEGELIRTSKILRAARKALTALAGTPDINWEGDPEITYGRIE